MSLEDLMQIAASNERASRATTQIARAVLQQPERSSYASSRELAEIAGVDVSSVTRAAQAMGFAGWPELREALRTRYLMTLSVAETPEPAAERPIQTGGAARSLDADRRALALLRPDHEALARIARALADSRMRVALGTGSHAALAHLLADQATLLGYPTSAPTEGTGFAHAVGQLRPGDTVVAFDFRGAAGGVQRAALRAQELGTALFVVTDVAGSPLVAAADAVVEVPSEGGGRLPSLVGGLAAVNAICLELDEIDPARSAESWAAAESTRAALGTLRSAD